MSISNILLLILIYFVGFVLSLLFWIKFGKELGFDYDVPKDYSNYDDWDSNAEAYSAFSLFWFIDMPIIFTYLVWRFIVKLVFKLLTSI
jgi:hypothetical protein